MSDTPPRKSEAELEQIRAARRRQLGHRAGTARVTASEVPRLAADIPSLIRITRGRPTETVIDPEGRL